MSTSLKKLLLISITLLLGVMNSGAKAAVGTNYDFTYGNSTYAVTYIYEPYYAYTSTFTATQSAPGVAYMPWFGNASMASAFATGVAGNLSAVNYANFGNGAGFMVSNPGGSNNGYYYSNLFSATYGNFSPNTFSSYYYAVVTNVTCNSGCSGSGAPEIDGSLAPKVGFLLGCLFLMFGRKKQNSEPMLVSSAI